MVMLAGTDAKGTYNPQATMNRAQGAAVLNRLVDSSSRIKVDFSNPTTPPVVVGQVQTWTEGQNHSEPKVGDTVIKVDGTKVVLKAGFGGVLGAGQGVDIWSGMVLQNGVVVKEGLASWFDGRVFYKDNITGEMHTATQWNTISGVTHPGEKGSYNGEIRNTWWEYDTADEIWHWIGPVYQ
jgi:hypothetical protein